MGIISQTLIVTINELKSLFVARQGCTKHQVSACYANEPPAWDLFCLGLAGNRRNILDPSPSKIPSETERRRSFIKPIRIRLRSVLRRSCAAGIFSHATANNTREGFRTASRAQRDETGVRAR